MIWFLKAYLRFDCGALYGNADSEVFIAVDGDMHQATGSKS